MSDIKHEVGIENPPIATAVEDYGRNRVVERESALGRERPASFESRERGFQSSGRETNANEKPTMAIGGGDDPDFELAWEGSPRGICPWRHFEVAEFHGVDEISALYRYEITVLVREAYVDPVDLIQTRATLRIKTTTAPGHRVIHGIVTDARELGATHHGMLYEITLMPPLARAGFRKRCRIFLEKTTRQIIDAVLSGDPNLTRQDGAALEEDDGNSAVFAAAREHFAWRVMDVSRIDDVDARSYSVQYNESDLAFVSRILEEEGISYHFENASGVCLLVLSDGDHGRARVEPYDPLGSGILGRNIQHVRLAARLRSSAVVFGDYNWKQPSLEMHTPPRGEGELVEYAYPGRYPHRPEQGMPLARGLFERYRAEASYATASGTARILAAGSLFELRHEDARYEGDYLVTRQEMRGQQRDAVLGAHSAADSPEEPLTIRLEVARCGKRGRKADSGFRPARRTPRPSISGSQTAFISAEPKTPDAEINVGGPPEGEIGCVRLRFHWDRDHARLAQEPSSCWVRVSHMFGGAGQGALWHPRVGAEVIVEFEDGDPDRPLVTGRVYNGKNRPPVGSLKGPTYSTIKSFSTPGGEANGGPYNEIYFEDMAGAEEIMLHAARDWTVEVARNRNETVTVNSASTVGNLRSETTGSNRTTSVGINNTETVGSNEARMIGGSQMLNIGANQTIAVSGWQSSTIAGAVTLTSEVEVVVNAPSIVFQTPGAKISMGNSEINVEAEGNVSIKGVKVRVN